jgi:hypothetical protein
MRYCRFPDGVAVSRLLIALPLLALASVASAAGTAVPVSPQRIGVVGGESQVFSARFYDAQGRPSAGETVRFANDACGTFAGGGFLGSAVTDSTGLASISFTAMNAGFVRCIVTASGVTSGATLSYDVITYRVQNVAFTVSTNPVEPRPGQPFQVIATPRVGSFTLYGADISARVIAGSAGASIADGTLNTGNDGFVNFRVTPDGRIGDYQVEVDHRGQAVRVPITAPTNPWQDLWWSGSAENGWGMSIVQHRDMLFTMLYAYDDVGKPTWYVMPAGEWNAARTAFTGDVFLPRGTPYSAYDASRFSIGAPVGRATITFDAADRASLDYTISGRSGRKSISRTLFGEGGASTIAGLGDMWWGGVAQNGWGFSMLQQGREIFTLWFTYDETGAATWFAMPAGFWIDARTYRGALYRSSGSPWLGHDYDATQFRMSEIGWYVTRFNEDGTATFQYSVGGAATSPLPLERIPF